MVDELVMQRDQISEICRDFGVIQC